MRTFGSRRAVLPRVGAWCLIRTVSLALLGCARPAPPAAAPASSGTRLDWALFHGLEFLVDQQQVDGSWQTDHYAVFKDGSSLTPLVTLCLHEPASERRVEQARQLAQTWLKRLGHAQGTLADGEPGLSNPVYTAALAIQALPPGKEREAWVALLRSLQLSESLGWQPEDREYGGWGYCAVAPRKPKPGELAPPLIESNLSATVFALDALVAARVSPDDPAFKKALTFVLRCQNFGDDLPFDDGGFHFIYADPVRNKAGVAGKDAQGRERYGSYGSATADGVRALRHGGLPADHPRVAAGRNWLERHFLADRHPGNYAPERRANQEAVYFYWCWSVARTLSMLKVTELNTHDGKVRWADQLTNALLARQQLDGSWQNAATLVREDEPLLATALALQALQECAATGRGRTPD